MRRQDEAEFQMKIRQQLREDEGDEARPYQDARGIWTVGVGHNLQSGPLSERVRDMILTDDIEAARADVDRLGPWVAGLDVVRYGTLVQLRFNMGAGTLTRKNPRMLAALASGDFEAAATELLDGPWRESVGPVRARRLAEQLRTGAWQARERGNA
jgi:lysozyme